MEVPTQFLVSEEFLRSEHGQLGCRTCHGGVNSTVFAEAHSGLIAQPSVGVMQSGTPNSDAHDGEGVVGVCAQCHQEITENYQSNVHNTGVKMQAGLNKLISEDQQLISAFYQHNCSQCHATCGDCHVKSTDLEGRESLNSGHTFEKRPPITDSCYSCHYTGAAGEYIGHIDGMTTIPDVHYKEGLDCMDCHQVESLHGSAASMPDAPNCIDCHTEVYSKSSTIEAHRVHPEGLLSCQTCHSLPVEGCYNCHLNANEPADVVTRLQFKIGPNLNQDENHPYRYTVLRHIPTTSGMLDDFKPGLLPNYDNIPNWRPATPHNIQRITPQNRDCAQCHSSEARFLSEKDLKTNDPKANQLLINQIHD